MLKNDCRNAHIKRKAKRRRKWLDQEVAVEDDSQGGGGVDGGCGGGFGVGGGCGGGLGGGDGCGGGLGGGGGAWWRVVW
nr:hypothetical protein [Tanacetum cinerariifolium]